MSNLSEIEGKPAKIHVSKQKENIIIDCIVSNDDVVADDQFVKPILELVKLMPVLTCTM